MITEYFLQLQDCDPLYKESLFVQVSGLQARFSSGSYITQLYQPQTPQGLINRIRIFQEN